MSAWLSEARPRYALGSSIAPARPAQAVAVGFAVLVTLGTLLLLLPFSHAGPRHTTVIEALFTATSAVCVTGLTVVDTATHWSPFGQVVILLLIQAGGFGVMIFASLIGLVIARKLSVRSQLATAVETRFWSRGAPRMRRDSARSFDAARTVSPPTAWSGARSRLGA